MGVSPSAWLNTNAEIPETSPGEVTIEVPFIVKLDDFDNGSVAQATSPFSISFSEKLLATPKSVVVLKCAVSFSEG